MDNKTTHHVCPSCGWGSATVVCKRCGTEYTHPAVEVEKAEELINEPSKKDDMSWFVF